LVGGLFTFWAEGSIDNNGKREIRPILQAELEKALMDRAVEKGYWRFIIDVMDDPHRYVIKIKHWNGVKEAQGTGPTRSTALLAALMEARGR